MKDEGAFHGEGPARGNSRFRRLNEDALTEHRERELEGEGPEAKLEM